MIVGKNRLTPVRLQDKPVSLTSLYDGMPIAITLSKAGKMKKITMALVAGVTTGIAIYLIGKMIIKKKSAQQDVENSMARPKGIHAYEYTL